jgi:hypothetical protein
MIVFWESGEQFSRKKILISGMSLMMVSKENKRQKKMA